MFKEFQQVIEQFYPAVEKPHQFLLGVSGGVDSIVLLHLFHRLCQYHPEYYSIRVCHINHQLNEASDEWAMFVETLCQQLNIEAHTRNVDVCNQGDGLEAAARVARYQAMHLLIKPGEVLVTGQHQDDQVETFLLALKRGSGLSGLSGMQSLSRSINGDTLFRPLLSFSRRDIEGFAHEQALTWKEDPTNADTTIERNFLRHDVLPLLSERWPSFFHSVTKSMARLDEAERLLEDVCLADCELVLSEQRLCVDSLMMLPIERRHLVVRQWFSTYQLPMPSQPILAQIYTQLCLARADKQPQLQLKTHTIRRFNAYLYLTPKLNDVSNWQTPIQINEEISLPDALGVLSLEECEEGTLRATEFDEPATIQFATKGGSYFDVKLGHHRKLSDWFKREKVPPWERQRLPLLFVGQDLVAIGQTVVDDRYLLTEKEQNQKRGLYLQWKPE